MENLEKREREAILLQQTNKYKNQAAKETTNDCL